MPAWLSLVDVVVVMVIALFAWGGFQKGFASQIAYVITFICGGILLFFVYPMMFSYFGRVFRELQETYLMWVILATLLVLVIALYMLFSKLLAGLLKMQISSRADHGWGLALGLTRGILTSLLIMILVVMLERSGKVYDLFCAKSYAGDLVCREIVPRIQPRLTALYESKIDSWKAELMKQEEAGDIDNM
ncbi:CvpA family protein [Pontiellaceae bacterium B12227]|nr:CvpA family protein [Pontiellaceae bacterium B12227]